MSGLIYFYLKYTKCQVATDCPFLGVLVQTEALGTFGQGSLKIIISSASCCICPERDTSIVLLGKTYEYLRERDILIDSD